MPALLSKLTANIGNIHFTIRTALNEPDLAKVTNLYFVIHISALDLIQSCADIIDQIPDNSQLRDDYYVATYWVTSNDEMKEALCFECIKHYKKVNDMVGIVRAYQITSYHHVLQDDPEKALAYAQMSIDIASHTGDENGLAWSFYRLGDARDSADQYIDALKAYKISQYRAHIHGYMYLELQSVIAQLSSTSRVHNSDEAMGLDNGSSNSDHLSATRAYLHFFRTEFLKASQLMKVAPPATSHTGIFWDATTILYDVRVSSIPQDEIYQRLANLPHPRNDQEQMFLEVAWAAYYFNWPKDYKEVEA
ncbi:hypothetical protein C8J56DRAFT_881356 [Mycena floridula]|nr:hypothetical protein C8J56DRAFT_881356 [Mycena floridula]